jgi:hypothetical protein
MLITIQSLKERRIAIYREGRGKRWKGRTLIDGRVLRPYSLLLLACLSLYGIAFRFKF